MCGKIIYLLLIQLLSEFKGSGFFVHGFLNLKPFKLEGGQYVAHVSRATFKFSCGIYSIYVIGL